MSVITLRMTDDKATRLKSMAQAQGISVNRLMDELTSMALTEFDAKTRFMLRAKQGDAKRGIELLDKALQKPA
ncbi:CopG family transcriptional regulator [Moraxella bovoculi]|uniref:CopG family transcriptional regulator n=1 Tax=Moraxella bovoculi TaxID=386891 RepID=A0AAC8PWS9_9GAMM|nr:hypothetical protein [Moraxella bovoculi]AKG08400.1 CopG family transcriptional regulator [Moraxella bovoculi]AKG09376.1 CopG family transcriptional regulator [Moraxella bovoculi]AKG12261.1 CopG family transcriptional regulator [Moraxella bovoculi]AKG13202.1 CopG family transcriptional regulator [Moraxella bovoculi]AKG14232.1 CopG family transcriptional regulator [Moraxella bovoculi]